MNAGHYWTFDSYLRKALRELSISYMFLNPNASQAKNEDLEVNLEKHFYVNIDSDDFVNQVTQIISSHTAANRLSKIVILIPWIPQFSTAELARLEVLEKITTVSYAGVTLPTAEQLRTNGNLESPFQRQEFFQTRRQHILWVGTLPDSRYSNMLNFRHIPDYAETQISPNSEYLYDLSFFGQLSSYRGLFEIMAIALFNPQLRIRIKGHGFSAHRIFRPWKYRVLRYQSWRTNPLNAVLFSALSIPISFVRFSKNVTFSNIPFESESLLDAGLGETRAILYCPKLPHGSGIVNKSLAAGIPILWNGISGQAFNLLKEKYPTGNFKFWELFIPGRIAKKVRLLPSYSGTQHQNWEVFKAEIAQLKSFLTIENFS